MSATVPVGDAQRMTIIEVTDLVKRYGDTPAVDGISFSVEEGEIFGILGPNGAGKTTTSSLSRACASPTAARSGPGARPAAGPAGCATVSACSCRRASCPTA